MMESLMLSILQRLCDVISQSWIEWLDAVANVLVAIVSIANLIIVIYIFYDNKKEKHEDRKRARDIDWYGAIDTKEYIQSISAAIGAIQSKVLEILDGHLNMPEREKRIKSCIEIFNTNILSQKRKTMIIAGCINKKYANRTLRVFSEAQDLLFGVIVGCAVGAITESEARNTLLEIENDCVALVYKIGAELA